MSRVLFAACLLGLVSFQAVTAFSLQDAKPKETIKEKLQNLDKMSHAVSWHKELEAEVPAHVKAAVQKARPSRALVKDGSCEQKLLKKLSHKKASAFLSKAPEHAGANSYAKPGVGSTQVKADNGLDAQGTVDGQEPFEKVLKDGFFEVGCYHDAMLEFGDKFGDDKDKYGSVASHAKVSIAKYSELVLKDQQKEMTPRLCYEFCRGLKGMVFFGVTNGNECYCEPYFKPQAGDDASCDTPCQGSTTETCGNAKGKSTIWEMHLCADTAEDLAENTVVAEEALTFFHETAGLAVELGKKMTDAGDALEEVAGLSGSPKTGDLGMAAKQAAGRLSKAWMDARPVYESLLSAGTEAKDLEGGDFTVAATVTSVEHAVQAIKSTEGKVRSFAKDILSLVKLAYPAAADKAFGEEPGIDQLAEDLKTETVATDFRLASYAMGEKLMDPQATTCSGPVIGMPMVGLGENGCGIACEHTVSPSKCVAFGHYQVDGKEDLCFMFSDVKDVETFEEPAPSLVQAHQLKKGNDVLAAAVCKVKMSELSTGFKPKGELKKNARCFGSCGDYAARDSVAAYSVPSSVTVNGKEVIGKLP